MSTFMDRITARQDNDRLASQVDYGAFRRLGALRAVTVRLPISTIAKMTLLEEKSPGMWESRQEMLFEMIESCIRDWTAKQSSPEAAHIEFQEAARRALRPHVGQDKQDNLVAPALDKI